MIVYSQLTLVSLDALSCTEALPCVDVAHVGMAVTLACCKEKTKVEREREMCIVCVSEIMWLCTKSFVGVQTFFRTVLLKLGQATVEKQARGGLCGGKKLLKKFEEECNEETTEKEG